MKKKFLSIVCASALCASMLSAIPAIAYNTADGVVINEVCTGNNGANSNLTDVVDSSGDYCDWIELYNPSDHASDLTGLYITDDSEDLTQAKIPDGTTIASHGYLIIYCGKKIVDSDYPGIVSAKFGLSADGETLILSDGTNAIDTFEVPGLDKDVTWARVPSGGEETFLSYPTPSAENTESAVIKSPDSPTFSRESGAFTDSFELTISASDGAKIYYTTDGSTPTEKSTEYKGAIIVTNRTSEPNVLSAMDKSLFTDRYGSGSPTVNVDKATVIRAIAVKDGQVSAASTASYFVGITNKTYSDVAIISIVTDSDNLFDPDTGIYMLQNVDNRGKEWERPVHIDFIENNTAVLSQDCGMRIQGGYSRTDYQKSLRFYARESYGADKFDYPLIPNLTSRDGEGRVVDSFEKFVLRNGGNDANYVKFKDTMLQSMVSEMNFSTQSGRPCIAFINGEYWGLYTLQEDYTDDYVKSHYDVKKKNVVIIKPDSQNNNTPKVEEGEDEDLDLWTDTINWINSCDLTDESQYEKFKTMFDVYSLADYFAVETYITNEDWSGKNWCVWRSREADSKNPDYSDCKWRFMLYDTEMGAYLWGNKGESPQNNKLIQIYESGKNKYDPIATILYKAMQNSEFKSLLKGSMITSAEKYDMETYESVLESYKSTYYPNLKKYFERFPTGSAMWSADQCIGWMNDFFLGTNSLPARQDYYETMLRTVDLFQIYDRMDTSSISSDKLSKIKSAYNTARSSVTKTGTSASTQKKNLDTLQSALADAGLTSSSHTHNYAETKTTAGTCISRGLITYTCSICGDCYIKQTEKADHDYIATVIAPTKTEQGYTLHTCSVCQTSYKDNYKDYADPSTASIKGTADISGIDSDDTISIEVKSKDKNTTVCTVDVTEGEYCIPTLDKGNYEIVVSSGRCTARTYQTAVGDGTTTLDVTIHLIGDINGDGKISTADVGRANSHAKGVSVLSGYEFDCADVNNDEKITTADVGRVNSHAKGVSLLFKSA